MTELIKVKNASYDRYEELLVRRDALKKQAFQYERAFTRKFGDLILEIFELKIDCIRKKKTIAFCQAAANRGKAVDQVRLQAYLKEEMESFQEQLDYLIASNEAAKDSTDITEAEVLQIKKIYHKLAKLIHPDINPMVEGNDTLRELWQRAVAAYRCNDLSLMQETELLVSKALDQLGLETIEIEIPDINERIDALEKEITQIRETDPYQYKFLLDDEALVQEKMDSLLEEKASYEEYALQLDELLTGLLGGVTFRWQMN